MILLHYVITTHQNLRWIFNYAIIITILVLANLAHYTLMFDIT